MSATSPRTPAEIVKALVDSLHALVRHAHDDHTVATEAADMLVDLARRLTEQDAEIARLLGLLADCYRATGADPDGNEDWRLAEDAVTEVQRLRQDSEAEILAAEQALAAARRERDEARANTWEAAAEEVGRLKVGATVHEVLATLNVVQDMCKGFARVARPAPSGPAAPTGEDR